MPTNWDKVYQNAGMGKPPKRNAGTSKKTTGTGANPQEKTGSTNWAKVYREAGMKMQAPELEELGAVPDFTVDNSWQGSMDLGNVDVNAGYGEFERQRGLLDTLQRYQEAAARNAQKAADYFDYAQDEASAQSFQKALELYQQATDKYNSAVGTYNTGVENFQMNPAVAKQQRQIAAVQRAQNKSYAELEQMITETAEEMDQTTDENARAQLQEQMDIYKAVQSQTEMTAADAAKRQGELERELATTKDDTQADWILGPNGTPIITRTEYGKTAEKARELSRMQNEEYNRTYEEAIAEMPAETREKILAAGAAAESFNRDFGAFQRGQGGTAQEIAEKSAAAQKTMDEARAILRSEGYSAEEIGGFIDWGTQEQNRVSAEKYAAEAEARAMERGTLGNLGASVATGIASGAGHIDLLMQEVREAGKVDPLTGKKKALDFNTDAMMPAVVKNAVIAGESDRIVEKMGLLYGRDEDGNLTEEAQKKADLRINAFQLADSMGESAVNMGLSLLGVPGTTLILASGAATQTAIQMKEAGYSDGQALAMAGAAGFAEWATEKWSLENFKTIFGERSVAGMSRKQAVTTTLANIGKQAFTEGSEEMASDILNLAADFIILGQDSQWQNKVRDYVEAGMTEQNAYRKVMRDEIAGWGSDFIGGAISGGIFGAAGTGLNIAVNNRADTQTGRAVREAGNAGQITDMVKAMDKAVQEKAGLAKYDESSDRMVGRAARTMVGQQMDSAIGNRLAELGESNPSDVLIAAIRDSAEPDVQLNRQEKKALAESKFGQQVAEEMNAMGQYGGKSAAQLALEGFWNGTLNESNAWVIQALAEQEETERKLTKTEQDFADRRAEGQTSTEREQPADEGKSYSRRASEIYADEEQRKAFERLYGPLEGSATENRALIARTLRAVDRSQYSAEEETAGVSTVHTEEQLSTMDEFNNATDTALVSFYERSNAGENLPPYELKPVSDRAAGEIKRITGIDTAGNRTLFESRMAKHIMNRHGENGTADNSMSDPMNMGRLQWVLDNFDYAEDGGTSTAYVTNKPNGKHGNAKTVNFIKSIDGEIIVVEAVPDTKKKTCFIVSAYMKKAASDSVNAGKPTHAPTSETAGQTTASAGNVAQEEDAVKSETTVLERETPQYTGEESYVRGLMKEMSHANANEIQRSPELRAAWESLTGEKLSENRKEAHDQLLNWTESEKTDIRDASERAYNETEDQITELAENGRLEIQTDDGTMDLRLQESRRGGAVAAVTREGQPPVLFEGDTIADAAKQAVEYAKGEQNGGQGTRAGGERAVGLGAEGSAEGLAGEAGSDQSGTEQSRRIEKINALALQQSSAAAQGVANGTDTVKNRFFRPGDSEAVDKLIREDAEYAAVAALCKARGQNLILFTGLLEVNEGGKVILADGMQQGSDIYIRADGNEHTPLKIYEHEDTHDAIEAAGGENGALYQSMKEKLIRSLGGEEQFEALKAKYAEALPDGYSEYDIVQEMLADARGTMNDFKGNTKLKAELDEEVRQQIGERRTGSRGSGSRSSYAGQLSKTADTNMLSRAEQMEQQNIDAETIRQETGWFRGADGEWRYEIDDSRARISLNGDARFRQEHPGYARYMELMDNVLYGNVSSEEYRELAELDKEWTETRWKLSEAVKNGDVKLGDVMLHDALFEAYPDIADITVSFSYMGNSDNGYFSPSENRIVINESMKDNRDALMNTLLHEVQHVIQHKEGFASGTNTDYWSDTEKQSRAKELYQERYDTIWESLTDEERSLYEEYKTLNDKWLDFYTDPAEMETLEAEMEEKGRELSQTDWFLKLEKLDSAVKGVSPVNLYLSTAGEQEARNVAVRRTMTEEERKNSPPFTGNESTVFAEDNGLNMSIVENNNHEQVVWVEESALKNKPNGMTDEDFIEDLITQMYENNKGFVDFIKSTGEKIYPATRDDSRGQKYSLGEEYTRSKYTQRIKEKQRSIFRAKMNAAGVLDEMVQIAKPKPLGWDEATHTANKDADNGVDHFVSCFAIPIRDTKGNITGVKAYDCELVIINASDGNSYLYDVTEIKGNQAKTNGLLQRRFQDENENTPASASLISNGNVPQNTGNVNTENASSINVDTDTETAVSAEEIERNQNTQEPLQDTGITDNRFTEALKKIGVNNITGSLVDYAGIEVEQQTARTAAEARRYLRRVLKETRADPRTQAFAHDVARGIYTMDDLPNTMSRGIVEELADAYRFAEGVVQDSLAYKRRQINAGLDADARKLFADSDNYNPAKFGRLSKTLMNERTPARVLRSIFGEEKGSEIYEAYWRPIIENNAAAKLWKNKQREDVKTFRDSKGTIRELTVDESAYAMKVLEGLAFEEEARNAAGMDKENLDRYIANFNQLMELMPKTGYNTEADRVDDVLSGRLTRSEAAEQSTNKALFEQIMENRLATASLPELSRALQTTLDGYEAALQARQEIRENDTVDAEIIDTAARAYQQKYQDMYTAINQLLVAHGYEEIGFIKGYAPHMQPETAQNGFQRAMEAMGLTGNVSSLPASIAGQTANFKPNMRYNPHFQSRTGNTTEYDIAKGFQEYTNYLGDIIYHMDDIMRLRRAVNYFRTEYAGEGISERIGQAQQMLAARTEDKIRFAEEHDLGYIPGMTDGQVADLIEKYIEDNYGETGKLTKYSEFTTWLENAANLLAGKQSLADRGLEYTGGRQMLNVANKLMTLFRQSKVAGSLSSALNQVAQLPAITTHLGAEYSMKALSDIGSGEITAEWRERSAFLVGKMDEVKLRESGYDKFMKWLFTPSSFVDDTIATMAVRGEYLRQMDMGKSDYEAMRIADDYGRQVMGSRAKLEKPQAYESKRPVSQMIHMFQVEAVNSFDYIVSDLPVEIRNMAETQGKTKAATATAAAIVAYLLQAFLLNRLGEEIYGGTPIPFDLLGTTAQFFASGEGLTANEYLLEVIDNGLEDMGQERIFGTENNIGAQDFDTKAALADVGRIAGDDIPLVRNMMAAVGWGDQTLPMINVANIGKGAKQIYEGAKEGDLRYAVEGASNIAGEVVPGGGQIKKAVQGLSTVAFGGAYSGAGEERQLKYGVDRTARNWIKAGLFGRSALSQNEQYYAGKAKTLTAGQTDVWEMLVDEEGMEPEAAYKAVQKYRAIGNDKGLDTVERNKRERAVIAGLKISDGAKAEMWVDLTHGGDHTNERYQNIMRMMRMGASWADVNTAFNEYERLYHDENLSGTGKATEFAQFADEYAARHGMSEYMVEAMKDTFGFSSGHRAEATAYEKLTGSDISTNHAGYIYELWSGLQPDPGKSTVSDVQKLYALGAASALSDEERYAAAGTLTDGEEYNEDGELTAYGKMLEAQRQGMPFADYTELRNEGAVDYYFKYRGVVQDNDVARDIAIGMRQLNRDTPEDETVQDWQRVNVICSATDDEDYQVAAMEELMEESEYFRFLQSNAHGVTPKIWAKAMEMRPKFDTNYNGSYTQAEYTALVKAVPGLDTEQQAALWQMLAHGKRNPFDAAVGREIYDDYGVWSDAKKKREAAERKAKVEG